MTTIQISFNSSPEVTLQSKTREPINLATELHGKHTPLFHPLPRWGDKHPQLYHKLAQPAAILGIVVVVWKRPITVLDLRFFSLLGGGFDGSGRERDAKGSGQRRRSVEKAGREVGWIGRRRRGEE